VLSDQTKSLDWVVRKASRKGTVSPAELAEVRKKSLYADWQVTGCKPLADHESFQGAQDTKSPRGVPAGQDSNRKGKGQGLTASDRASGSSFRVGFAYP
jgi:hypothetical protein